jgi:hypothetical protein
MEITGLVQSSYGRQSGGCWHIGVIQQMDCFVCERGEEIECVVVCVCSCPPVMRGDTVNHAPTSTSSPPQ